MKNAIRNHDAADEHPYVRHVANHVRAQEERWAAYSLPTVAPLTEFADYAEAAAKRREFRLECSAAEREFRRTSTEIARGMAARSDEKTDLQAQQILAGKLDEAFDDFEDLRAKRDRLAERMESFSKAVRLQDEVIATIRSERSIDAAEAMAPAHRTAVLAIAELIAQLREAFDREEAARTFVTRAGYDARLPIFGAGLGMQEGGPLDHIERQAREYAR